MQCQKCKARMFWQSTKEQWFCLHCRAAVKQLKPLTVKKKYPRAKKKMSLIVQLAKELDGRIHEHASTQTIPESLRAQALKTISEVRVESPILPDRIGLCPKGHTTFYQQRHDRFYCLKCRRVIK